MKILKGILLITILSLLISCGLCPPCPDETVIVQGSLYCNGEFRHIFTEIEKGELDDSNNYITKKEWEKVKENIKFDEQKEEKKDE